MNIVRVVNPAQIGALLALVAVSVLVALPAWRDIISVAVDREDQSHILLAIPVAIWLGIVRADRLRFCTAEPSWLGVVTCLAGILISEIGFRTGVDMLWHGGALMSVVGAVLSVVGLATLRRFLPSVLALAFLLPVPGRIRTAIAIPLQEISARVTEVFLDLLNFPITRSGNILTINDQAVAVAEACNGMRMIGSLALVTFAFAFSIPMRNRVRLVLLAISPVIALLVNIIRLIPSTLMYGYAGKNAADLFHDLSGWGVLALALLILWGVLQILRWLEIRTVNFAVRT